LGFMYENGQGCDYDDTKAALYYKTASEMGNAAAMLNRGFMNRDGRGVERDIDIALQLFSSAAKNGNEDAKKFLPLERSRNKK